MPKWSLTQINLNNIKCSSCIKINSNYYCLICYKTFCLKCKEEHIKQCHNEIIELQKIDNICYRHNFGTSDNKYESFFVCDKCFNKYLGDNSDYLSTINDFEHIYIEEEKKGFINDINKIFEAYRHDETITKEAKKFQKRINDEINLLNYILTK